MPAQRSSTSKASEAKADKYKKPAKKVKLELPLEEKLRKKWHSIRDQIQDGYSEKALKTCKQGE